MERYTAFHNLIVPQSFAKDFLFGKEYLFYRCITIRKNRFTGQRMYYGLNDLWFVIVNILEGNDFFFVCTLIKLVTGKLNEWISHFKQERPQTLAYVERLIQLLLLFHINCKGFGADLAKSLDKLVKLYPFVKAPLRPVWILFIGQLQTKQGLYTASSDFVAMMQRAGEPFVMLRR